MAKEKDRRAYLNELSLRNFIESVARRVKARPWEERISYLAFLKPYTDPNDFRILVDRLRARGLIAKRGPSLKPLL